MKHDKKNLQTTQNVDVCAGGIASTADSSFTFVNNHPQICSIAFTPTTPPGANATYAVPAMSGSTPGTKTVNYTSGITGTYGYVASCCPQDTNPNIKMQ